MESNNINTVETGYGLLIQYTRTEILRVQDVIKQASKMEIALKRSLDSLESLNISFDTSQPTKPSELDEKLQTLREPGYPYKGTKSDKIIFLMKKFNVAVRVSELTDEFLRIEGYNDGRTVSKGLHYKLNQLVADGILVVAKWHKSKLIYYCLPEYFNTLEKGNMILKEEHLPKSESWGNTPENERNFNKAKWIFFIKRY